MNEMPIDMTKILSELEKTHDPKAIMDILEKVLSHCSSNGSDLIKRRKYTEAANEFNKIELAHNKAIEVMNREQSGDFKSFLALLQDTATYWKKRSEMLRNDAFDECRMEGLSYFRDGNHEKALELFTKALKTVLEIDVPRRPDPNWRKRFTEALKSVQETNRASIPALLVNIGNVYYSRHEFTTAKMFYLTAIDLQPQDSSALYNMGLIMFNLADNENAIKYFQKVLAINENDANALAFMGFSFVRMKKIDEGFNLLEEATYKDPQNMNAWYFKGVTFNEKGWNLEGQEEKGLAREQYENAISTYKRALEYSPKDVVTLTEIARTYNNLGRISDNSKDYYKESMRYLSKASELAPHDLEIAKIKGDILFKEGRYTEAAGIYSEASKLNPDSVELEMNLSEALLLSKEYLESEKIAKQILEKITDPVDTYIIRYVIVCSLYMQGRQEADDEAKDLINYYESIPEKYDLKYDFAGIEKLISESDIPKNRKMLLADLILLINKEKDAAKVMEQLRFMSIPEKQVRKFLGYPGRKLGLAKTMPEFSIVNTASPARRKPGWYDWEIYINEAPEKLAEIKSVTYYLHPTFRKRKITVSDSAGKFKLKGRGWGSFRVKTDILLKSGETVTKHHWLEVARAIEK